LIDFEGGGIAIDHCVVEAVRETLNYNFGDG